MFGARGLDLLCGDYSVNGIAAVIVCEVVMVWPLASVTVRVTV